MPKVGTRAPLFTLEDEEGKKHTLGSYQGKWVLVYFYPKDDTSGCTKEACAIRDSYPAFKKLDAVVFGISADSVTSHKKFAEKYELPFTLLSDPKKKTIRAYGVWQKKTFMGKKYMGIVRTSFLIDPMGVVKKVYEKVKPDLHAEEVLRDLKEFNT